MSNVIFEWVQPDTPLMVARATDELAAGLRDVAPVLEGSRSVVIEDVVAHFEEERAPSGEEWAEWAPSYAPVASRMNISKLRQSLDLFNAATDPTAYPVMGDSMFIDTSGFPEYWAIQQYGGLINSGSTLVRRVAMRHSRDAERREAASNHGRIPARPYLGMSDKAEEAVGVVFNMWVEGEIIGWVENPLRGPGVFQPRMASGRFGPIPSL
jgi:phage gpG-like protein